MKSGDNSITNSQSEKTFSSTQNITLLRSNTVTDTFRIKPESESKNEDNSFTKSMNQLVTQLVNMGFENRSTNLQILKKHNGNLVETVTELMS